MLVWSTLSSYGGETEVQRGPPKQDHSGEPLDLLVPAILYACEGREVRGEAEALGEVGGHVVAAGSVSVQFSCSVVSDSL